uniref:Uncharacterized protein n=1 Tax=uncultured Armatimonadetes bacterium TaxID=157466 RepID=A0A6J4JTP2_9BACT|nr:hypothetical protein AVDCRST_MAG63-4412 [uncultured Armatimonadetes bacterium]
MARKLTSCIAAFLVVPLVLGLLAYAALRLQPAGAWKRLMPAAVFSQPRRGLDLLVLAGSDAKDRLEPFYESHYFYPDGKRYVLLQAESLTDDRPVPVSDRASTYASVYAVDRAGRFTKHQIVGPRQIRVEPADEVRAQVDALLAHALVVCEDAATLEEMRARLPGLRTRTDVLFFDDALRAPAGGGGATGLGLSVAPRIASLIGGVLAAGALLALLARDAAGRFRLVLCLLSLPLVLTTWIWAVLVLGPISPALFGVLPYLVWAALALAATWMLVREPEPAALRAFGLDRALTALRARPLPFLLAAGSAVAWALCMAPFFLRDHLTEGDAVKFVRSSMYLYDDGRWPLARIVADFGPRSHHASYPPGIAILMAFCSWMAAADAGRLFFPGPQTGATWLLYGGLLMLLHLCLIAAAVFVARALAPDAPVLWALAALFVLVFVPSAHGSLHGGESILWPLFGLCLAAAVTYRYTQSLAALGATLILMTGLVLLKNEGKLYCLFLVLPWLLSATPILAPFRKAPGATAVLVGMAVLAVLPSLLLGAQKDRLQVALADYAPFSLPLLLSHWRDYFVILKQTTAVWLGVRGTQWAPYPALPFVLAVVALVRLQQARFSWRRFLVPLGICAFCLAMPILYVFALWVPLQERGLTSWGRLLVPVATASGMCLLSLVAELRACRVPAGARPLRVESGVQAG